MYVFEIGIYEIQRCIAMSARFISLQKVEWFPRLAFACHRREIYATIKRETCSAEFMLNLLRLYLQRYNCLPWQVCQDHKPRWRNSRVRSRWRPCKYVAEHFSLITSLVIPRRVRFSTQGLMTTNWLNIFSKLSTNTQLHNLAMSTKKAIRRNTCCRHIKHHVSLLRHHKSWSGNMEGRILNRIEYRTWLHLWLGGESEF